MMKLKQCGHVARCLAGLALTGTMIAETAAQPPLVPAPAPAVEGSSYPTPPVPYEPVPQTQFAPAPGSNVIRYNSAAMSGPSDDTYYGCQCRPKTLEGWWRQHKARQQHKWWGYADEFEEVPFGTFTQGILEQQVANGQKARLALYDYDFVRNSGRLNARGQARIAQLLPLLQNNYGPLIIEQTPSRPALNEARRIEAMKAISGMWPDVYPELVIVGQPRAAGLSGAEAQVINQALMNRTTAGSVQSYGLSSSSTGFVSGFGGSGSQSAR